MREIVLEKLLDAGRMMTEQRAVEPVLHYAMDQALNLFDAEYGYLILLTDEGTLDFRVRRDRWGNDLDHPEQQVSHTILERVIKKQEDLLLADAVDDPSLTGVSSVMSLRIRSVMSVPLISRGQTIGAIYLENRTSKSVFAKEALLPLKIFAGQAAVAISNARLIESLESRVVARTETLSQAVEDLDAYAETVAHDLKNPVAVISGHLALLLEDLDTISQDDIQEILEISLRQTFKMGTIIDSLLLLASLRRANEVSASRLDMAAILSDVIDRLSPLIGERKAQINLPETWPVAMGYRSWVEQVWINYISNAIKYGGTPPVITLGANRERDMIRFWVQDNGAGISPEKQSSLFRPFTRLDDGREEGHGLGLSIVRRIADKLEGHAGAISDSGQGSTFYLMLPAESAPES